MPVILLSAAAALTIRAWGFWHAAVPQPRVARWRSGAFSSGLVTVSVALIIFLGIGVYAQISGGLGYNFSPATLWVRIDLWLCIVGLSCGILGKGSGRGLVVAAALIMLGFWFGLALST